MIDFVDVNRDEQTSAVARSQRVRCSETPTAQVFFQVILEEMILQKVHKPL